MVQLSSAIALALCCLIRKMKEGRYFSNFSSSSDVLWFSRFLLATTRHLLYVNEGMAARIASAHQKSLSRRSSMMERQPNQELENLGPSFSSVHN